MVIFLKNLAYIIDIRKRDWKRLSDVQTLHVHQKCLYAVHVPILGWVWELNDDDGKQEIYLEWPLEYCIRSNLLQCNSQCIDLPLKLEFDIKYCYERERN